MPSIGGTDSQHPRRRSHDQPPLLAPLTHPEGDPDAGRPGDCDRLSGERRGEPPRTRPPGQHGCNAERRYCGHGGVRVDLTQTGPAAEQWIRLPKAVPSLLGERTGLSGVHSQCGHERTRERDVGPAPGGSEVS